MREFVLEFDVPVSVTRQFDILFGEPSFKRTYHLSRGDKDVSVSEWKNNERTIVFLSKFDAPAVVRKAIGKETTLVREVQKRHQITDQRGVVTAETFFTDVPMSDQYSTHCEWLMTPTHGGGSHCRITVQVAFKKMIYFVTAGIEKMMHDKGYEAFQDFCRMAREHVAARLQQERREAALAAAAAAAVSAHAVLSSPTAMVAPAAVAGTPSAATIASPAAQPSPIAPLAAETAAGAESAPAADEFFDASAEFVEATSHRMLPPPPPLLPPSAKAAAPPGAAAAAAAAAATATAEVGALVGALDQLRARLDEAASQVSALTAAAQASLRTLDTARAAPSPAAPSAAAAAAAAGGAMPVGWLASMLRHPVGRGLSLVAVLVAWPVLARVLVRTAARWLQRWQRLLE